MSTLFRFYFTLGSILLGITTLLAVQFVVMAQARSDGTGVAFQLQDDSIASAALVEMDISHNLRRTVYRDQSGGDRHPAWSPDGHWLAFVAMGEGARHIYLIDDRGRNLHSLSERPVANDDFSWSADSRRIAFVSIENRNRDIHVVDIELDSPSDFTSLPGDESRPTFSPDGRWVAFQSNRLYGAQYLTTIYIMRPDGSDLHPLTETPVSNAGFAWSPDGQQLVYSSYATGNGDIYVGNADGRDVHQLTADQTLEYGPVWSPDGRKIAFWSWQDLESTPYVINPDGSGLLQIGETRQAEKEKKEFVSLEWSADSRQILIVVRSVEQPGLYLAEADGSGSRYLLENTTNHADPTWRPGR